MTDEARPSLKAAALKLESARRQERDDGESALVAAGADSIPALVFILERTATARAGEQAHSPVRRAALLVGALRAREAKAALCKVVRSGSLSGDDGAFVARAFAEMLDGRDAFDDDVRLTLEALSTSPDMYTRAYAAQAFGALGDFRSLARVQALTTDSAPWVRDKAHAILVKNAEERKTAFVASTSLSDFSALIDDAQHHGGVLRPYIDDLKDERPAVRDAAVNALVSAGKSAVSALENALNQPHVRTRIGAALALGRLQPPSAAGPLLIAATAPAHTKDERELRIVALRALANCLTGLEEGLGPSLLPLSRDADPLVRAAALLCLGRISDRRGMRAVVIAILEDDRYVQESAAIALSEGAREDDADLVRPLLVGLAQRPAPRTVVREAILIALSRITIIDEALRVRARHRVRRELAGSVAMKKAAIVLLERLYSDDDAPPLNVVDDVLTLLSDPHHDVRVCAASFLATHLPSGFIGAGPIITTALQRHERTVSLLCLDACARAASHGHDEHARAILSVCARSGDDVIAARAREHLAHLAPSTTPASAPEAATKTMPPARAESLRPRRVRTGTDIVDAKDPTS